MLYVRGDIHADPISAFSFRNHPEMRTLTKDDYMVILGDFGVVWGPGCEKDTHYKLNWLNNRPQKTVVLLGNHDNWDWALSLPKIDTEIGEVRQCVFENIVYDNIYIVADPSVLNICGEKCFCIPGAECHDLPGCYTDAKGNEHSDLPILGKDKKWHYVNGDLIEPQPLMIPQFFREEGKHWWKDEAIDVDSAGEILYILKDNEVHIDFVFSHDAPAIQLTEMNKKLPAGKEIITEGEHFLQRVVDELDFDCFFHGHLHWDRLQPSDNRIMCLFSTVLNLSLGEILN